MKIYVFGNEDEAKDSGALAMAKKIIIKGIEYVEIGPNGDLPSVDNLVIMDVVEGLTLIKVFNEKDLEKVKFMRVSAHDYDLGFQLRYLAKIGKLKKVTIVGLPMDREIDFVQLQSILRKLVAQDMQGS